MRILLTGASGQLGRALTAELALRAHEVIGAGRGESQTGVSRWERLDLTQTAETEAVVRRTAPDAVIHCAAWTDVDAAEKPENREAVFAVNAGGTEALARASAETGAKLLYLSTDYVFSGEGYEPWQTDSSARPLSVYGESKRRGEEAVQRLTARFFIVRIGWLFSPWGRNFPRTILKLAETHETLRVVSDQIGTPTYAPDLSRLLADMIATENYGIYHAGNEGGYLSRADFAAEILQRAGQSCRVIPVTTEEYAPEAAPRPKNGRLDQRSLRDAGFTPLPDRLDALDRFLRECGCGR